MNQTEMKSNIHLVLASASPRRRELLRQIGRDPEILPSLVEEKVTSQKPEEVVAELSFQKAAEVAARLGEREEAAVVIGSDTVVSIDGKILGKPRDPEEARTMLRGLQGTSHMVYTGVTLLCGEHRRSFVGETQVEVYPMTEEEIAAYVASGDPMDKAGAYGIQGQFAAYIKGIRGSYTNVMGLPVGQLHQELKLLWNELAEEEAQPESCRSV